MQNLKDRNELGALKDRKPNLTGEQRARNVTQEQSEGRCRTDHKGCDYEFGFYFNCNVKTSVKYR